jgi:hypothetical protein
MRGRANLAYFTLYEAGQAKVKVDIKAGLCQRQSTGLCGSHYTTAAVTKRLQIGFTVIDPAKKDVYN